MLLVSFMLVAQKIIFRDVFTSVPIHLVLVVVHQRYFNIILIHLQANQSQLTLHPQDLQGCLISSFWPKITREKREKLSWTLNLQSLISSELKLKSKLRFHQNDPLFFLYITMWLIKAGNKVRWLSPSHFNSVFKENHAKHVFSWCSSLGIMLNLTWGPRNVNFQQV